MVLTVIADQTPPVLVHAQWLGGLHTITVTFSEPVEAASALVITDYEGGLRADLVARYPSAAPLIEALTRG